MPEPIKSEVTQLYIHPLQMGLRDLINKNTDVLNHILAGDLSSEGPHSFKSIKIAFQGRGNDLNKLSSEGFVDYSKQGGKAILRFPGFICCTSIDAVMLHEIAKRLYGVLLGAYKRYEEERWFSLKELVKAVYGLPDLPEHYRAVTRILGYFNTTPYHIVTLKQDSLYDNINSDHPIVRAGEQIIDYKDFIEFVSASGKSLANDFKNKYNNQSSVQEVTKTEIHNEKPIIFISYASEELALADFLRDVLKRSIGNQAVIFVAKRDIPSGDNPLEVMMENNLKKARAVIPVCSIKSKTSPWVWWESASVWAKGFKIYPLFTNLNPGQFGAPLNLVTQGKEFFNKIELIETFTMVCKDLELTLPDEFLNQTEIDQLEKLNNEYSKLEMSAEVNVSYKKHDQQQKYHKYSLIFDIVNKTTQKFDDVVLELTFPVDYLEKKKWEYPGLFSYEIDDKPGYLGLTFTFSSIQENAKKVFSNSLLPGKALRVFGIDGGMFTLFYEMDPDRWDSRAKYDITWKVYINGGAPIEGSRRFIEMQNF